jgi:hypothetical protein
VKKIKESYDEEVKRLGGEEDPKESLQESIIPKEIPNVIPSFILETTNSNTNPTIPLQETILYFDNDEISMEESRAQLKKYNK